MGACSSQEVGRVYKGEHLFTRGHVHLGNSVEHTEERPSSVPRTVAAFTCPRSAGQLSHAPDQWHEKDLHNDREGEESGVGGLDAFIGDTRIRCLEDCGLAEETRNSSCASGS